MARKLALEEWVARLLARGLKFKKCEDMGHNSKSSITVECIAGHEWRTTFNHAVNGRGGCPYCAKKGKRTKAEREFQIREKGFEVIEWVGEYKDAFSEVIVRCQKGHTNVSTVDNIVNSGKGCFKCGRARAATSKSFSIERILAIIKSKGMRPARPISGRGLGGAITVTCEAQGHTYDTTARQLKATAGGCVICSGKGKRTQEFREKQIQDAGVTFIRWLDGGCRNASSVAVVACEKGHIRHSSVDRLVNGRTGCPQCKVRGFDQTSPGVLYCLLADDGATAKIGITKNLRRRVGELRKATPFSFSRVGALRGMGAHMRMLEREAHARFENAGFSGFDGATEWVIWTPEVHAWLLAHS